MRISKENLKNSPKYWRRRRRQGKSKPLVFARSHVIMNVSDRFQTGKQNSRSMLYQERLKIKSGDTGVGGLQAGSPRVNSELMRASMYCPKDYGNKRQKEEVSRVAV